jgi:hypothetical protein
VLAPFVPTFVASSPKHLSGAREDAGPATIKATHAASPTGTAMRLINP